MKKSFLVLFLVFVCFSAFADPSPAPSAALIAVPVAASGLKGWIEAQGGILAAITAAVLAINVILSAIQTACNQLQIHENATLAAIGTFVGKGAAWLSANVANNATKPTTPPSA